VDIIALKEKIKDYKILYVEDEEELFEINVETLKLFFTNINCGKSGEEGLEIYRQNKEIEYIITDINMSGISGIEMAKRMKEDNSELIIIATTAHSEVELKEIDSNYKDYLDVIVSKPFILTEILTAIADIKKRN